MVQENTEPVYMVECYSQYIFIVTLKNKKQPHAQQTNI